VCDIARSECKYCINNDGVLHTSGANDRLLCPTSAHNADKGHRDEKGRETHHQMRSCERLLATELQCNLCVMYERGQEIFESKPGGLSAKIAWWT
jgi:hypothetical protein